jgi:NAD(P)-dependent dehydrogenase (short-subunit alcohol dehydrogenase family)
VAGLRAMVNGAVEAFVRAAALEIAPVRVNAVSPAVFIERTEYWRRLTPSDGRR